MGILSWIVLGLVAGIVAKVIMPGKDTGGMIVTILIGIAGAFVGGYLGSSLGLGDVSFNKPGEKQSTSDSSGLPWPSEY